MENRKIGVLAGKHEKTIGITFPYYEFASKLGEVVLISPLSETIQDVDLLILIGGADLDPSDYGAKPSIYTNKPNPIREWFDRNMLPKYIDKKTRIFGICLGMQSINSYFGGTLIQDNSSYHPFSGYERDKDVHKLSYTKNKSIYAQYVNNLLKKQIGANSLHHQSIDILGENLSIEFWDKAEYTPEIIIHNELPIVGFQGHPEEMEGEKFQTLAYRYIEALFNEF